MRLRLCLALSLILSVSLLPPRWYPDAVRQQLAAWLGAAGYQPPPGSRPAATLDARQRCPEDPAGWRQQQVVDGVAMAASPTCMADDPSAVAAFVRGTNNVDPGVLAASGLAPDAVVKGADLDGDGDPDEIHIRLEVVELNGGSPDTTEPVTRFAIAPGIYPGLWVFAPKTTGMATENFESSEARRLLRLPSPVIRVEQGDHVEITLENSHYMPHTIHFHGVDHPYVDANGEGNDGTPLTSELPVLPGQARTYNLTPRQAGTMFYHCHVQPHVHIMMGLQGMFVVEENRPNNLVQTLNVGAGHVRVSSAAVAANYDREYDLHYLDMDAELNAIIQGANDPRLITAAMHNEYDVTDATIDLFTVNGRSFPYTFRESLVVAKADQRLKLRVLNGGSAPLALHTHGHKATANAFDGVPLGEAARITRDVFLVASAQRVDLALDTTNDGRHSFGSGVWLMHDHQQKGITTNGVGPGGNISAIVYEDYLAADGWPVTQGMNFDLFFSEAYYRKELPIWLHYAGEAFGSPAVDVGFRVRVLLFGLFAGVSLALTGFIIWRRL